MFAQAITPPFYAVYIENFVAEVKENKVGLPFLDRHIIKRYSCVVEPCLTSHQVRYQDEQESPL